MSSTFTLHPSPFASRGDPHALEQAELVRDGFSWGACLVPALWFFWHRHWLLGIGALVAVVGLAAGLWGLGARSGSIVTAGILLHVLFGLEGASLRQFAYERRGRPAGAVVVASDITEAEAKSFGRWLRPVEPSSPQAEAMAPPGGPSLRPWAAPVIGLFPDAESRR